MRQIHTDIDTCAWEQLHARTSEWPEAQRSMAGICRYAIQELGYDVNTYSQNIPIIPMKTGKGKRKHIQVRTNDPEEAALWELVARSVFPGLPLHIMLRVALARLNRRLA